MTYYYSSCTTAQKKYEWTAFTESALVGSGNLGCGSTFTMPKYASVCMSTYDNDSYMSGDEYCDENASDGSGQQAYVNGAPKGSQLYAECYHVLKGSDGKTYYLIEIEVEGYNGWCEQDYFTFYGAVPPAGVTLTVASTCNVSGCMIDYDCLAKCSVAPPNTPPTFSNAPANCITVTENSTFVIDLNATDADGDALSYSIAGGADAALFTIDASTGKLTFKAAPDYEKPADAGKDNTYEVQVKVADGKGGEEVKALKVCVTDVKEGGGTCTVIEAETMTLSGYKVEGRGDASNGAGIVLCSSSGYAKTTFGGDSGTYDLSLTYMDESDGKGKLAVYVNGCLVKTVCLDKNTGGDGTVGKSSWSTLTLEDLKLNKGDSIIIKGYGDCGEYARLDKIEICKPDCAPCVTIEAEAMTACNFTTVCGDLASGGKLVKLATDWCGNIKDGSLATTFKACDGTYDLTLFAQDENDGVSTIVIKVNGKEVGTITLDGTTAGAGSGSDNAGFSQFSLQDIALKYGDKITIEAYSDGGEFVRIDKIQLCKDEAPKTGKIGDTVWLDADGDGVRDAGEAGVAGVTVTLLNADGTPTGQSTVTDANGAYLFQNLAAGSYKVAFQLPGSGFAFTAPNAGSDDAVDSDAGAGGTTGTITLAAGQADLTVDAGLVELKGSLSGRYFIDANGNDIDDGEAGVAGVTVELLDGMGNPTGKTTTTGANGAYSFGGLVAGTYGVRFTDTVTGLTLVTPNQGSDDAIDSDASDLGNGVSQITGIVVVAGADSPDHDAGVKDPETGSISGRLFVDGNDNSVDDGEPGIEGVTVTLVDGVGKPVATTQTGPNGEYTFTGLPAGDYRVVFPTVVDGKVLVDANVGSNDAIDSDADQGTGTTGVITLPAGGTVTDVDAGVEDPGTAEIRGRLFVDGNDNSVDDGEAGLGGITVTLLDAGGNAYATATTNPDGSYAFTGLPAGTYSVQFPTSVNGLVLVDANVGGNDAIDSDADQGTGKTGPITVAIGQVSTDNDAGVEDPRTGQIGDTVWEDLNGNGVQDAGEAGIAGVTVTLLNGDGTPTGKTATTDSNGKYLFAGLAAGTYIVDFAEADGFDFTAPNVGNDAADSDAGADGLTGPITIGIGGQDLTVDAGLVAENGEPTPANDTGKGCANTLITVDALANDTDPDGDTLAIVAVDGKAIAPNGSVTTAAGTVVSLIGGKLVIDGEAAYAGLNIGQQGTETISYTVSDGNGGTASADVTVSFCGVADTVQEFCASLPTAVTYQVDESFIDANPANWDDSGYDIKIVAANGASGALYQGLEFTKAYCLDLGVQVNAGSDFATAPALTGNMMCSANPAAAAMFANLDVINWILNQDYEAQGYSGFEVQAAIWSLTDNYNYGAALAAYPGLGQADDVAAILEEALEYGDGYDATTGDIVGLIITPNPATAQNAQPFIIGVEWADFDCLC